MRSFLLASTAGLCTLAAIGVARAQPINMASPGVPNFYLNGYAQASLGAFGSSVSGANNLSTAASAGGIRIDPGFDAATTGSINYGARGELWSGFTTTQTRQNGGPESGFYLSSIYLRRGYGYVGTENAGYLRLGLTDSAFTLLQTGVIETFGDGGQWTLDGGVRDMLPANAAPVRTYIYADQTALYATPKIVYISPDFAGLKFDVGYEPNSTGLQQADDNCAGANSTCLGPYATDSRGPGRQRKNTVDAALLYAATVQGVQVKAMAGMLYGSPNGGSTDGVPPPANGYDALTVYQAGAQASYAGVTLGVNVKGGKVEDQYAFTPRGARNALAYSIGASYAIGPVVAGASYFNSQSAGAYVPGVAGVAPTLSEYGIAVGGDYVLGPHISLFTQYMYGHRHQPGNLALSGSGNGQAQIFAGGAAFKW